MIETCQVAKLSWLTAWILSLPPRSQEQIDLQPLCTSMLWCRLGMFAYAGMPSLFTPCKPPLLVTESCTSLPLHRSLWIFLFVPIFHRNTAPFLSQCLILTGRNNLFLLPIEAVLTHCHKHTNAMSEKLLASTKSSTSSGARRLIADWTFLQGSREACDQHDRWKLMLSEISKSWEGQFLQTNHRDLMCSVVMIDHGSPARLFQLFYNTAAWTLANYLLKKWKGRTPDKIVRVYAS